MFSDKLWNKFWVWAGTIPVEGYDITIPYCRIQVHVKPSVHCCSFWPARSSSCPRARVLLLQPLRFSSCPRISCLCAYPLPLLLVMSNSSFVFLLMLPPSNLVPVRSSSFSSASSSAGNERFLFHSFCLCSLGGWSELDWLRSGTWITVWYLYSWFCWSLDLLSCVPIK